MRRASMAALAGIAACLALAAADDPPKPKRSAAGLPLASMQVGGDRIELEVADVPDARDRGLGGRSDVPRGTGMLFVFPAADFLSFWMLDCLVPIDVAFFASDGTVTAVHAMRAERPRGKDESASDYRARLPRYGSPTRAVGALELGAGEMARLGVKAGTKLALPDGISVPARR
jgi:uncharacterized membrane protein (UPF0127 family)